ncbi:GSCOCG00005769001-RA-CDS, partial [Cotesia congregata]
MFPFLFFSNLDSLGSLLYKMRIYENEDVYRKTRHRMAVCAENNQNKW